MSYDDRRKLAERMRPIVNRIRTIVDSEPKRFEPVTINIDDIPAIHPKRVDHRIYVSIDKNAIDGIAERQGRFMAKAYHSRTIGFGKRIRKSHGERHRVPQGVYGY